MVNTVLRSAHGVVATHADWSPRLCACLDAARIASLCFIARARSDLITSLSDRCRHRTSQLKLEERLEDEDDVLEGVGKRIRNVLMFPLEARDPIPRPVWCVKG